MRFFDKVEQERLGASDRPRVRSYRRFWLPTLAAMSLLLAFAAVVATYRRSPAIAFAVAIPTAIVAVVGLLRARRSRVPANVRQPPPDDRTLLDLSGAARESATLDEFFAAISGMIADAVQSDAVSILVRDDATGIFHCAYQYDGRSGFASTAQPKLSLASTAFAVRRLRSLQAPLAVTPEDLDAWIAALAGSEHQAARLAECDVLRHLCTRLLVQIRTRADLSGILALGPRRSGDYSASERRALVSIAGQVSLAIENAKLVRRVTESERMRLEIQMAAEVQQKLLPPEPPTSAHLGLAGFCQPARSVAGDYYDFFRVGEGRIAIAVADVAGKGVSAALLMSVIKALLHCLATAPGRVQLAPCEVIADCNRLLCQFTSAPRYVTLFYGEFDEHTRQFAYVNAGHNPPFLIRDGQATALSTGGPVLGVFPDAAFEQGSITLQPEDVFVGYTDGVVECFNDSGREFGADNIVASAIQAGKSPNTILAATLARLQSWCNGAPFDDDATLVVGTVA